MSPLMEDFDYLVGRKDIAELSFIGPDKELGQIQANRRFVGTEGFGIVLADTAAQALTKTVMATMMYYPFPYGTKARQPDRTVPWDPEFADLFEVAMSEENTLEQDFNELMASGHIHMIRFSLCSDHHWELAVKWVGDGPGHFAAPRNDPAKALRALIAHTRKVGKTAPPKPQQKIDREIEDLI